MLAFPPVVRGQAGAGEDPGLAVTVGVAVAVAVGRVEAVGRAEAVRVGLGDREADAVGFTVGDEATSAWGPHALTTTMPRARASAP